MIQALHLQYQQTPKAHDNHNVTDTKFVKLHIEISSQISLKQENKRLVSLIVSMYQCILCMCCICFFIYFIVFFFSLGPWINIKNSSLQNGYSRYRYWRTQQEDRIIFGCWSDKLMHGGNHCLSIFYTDR